MRFVRLVLAFLLMLAPVSFSQSASSAKPGARFSIDNIDKSVDPCVNFFAYSCGGWIKNNPIPPDQTNWTASSKLEDTNKLILRDVLETAAKNEALPAWTWVCSGKDCPG